MMATTTGTRAARLRRVKWQHVILHIVLLAGCIVMLLPFFWMLSTSLKARTAIFQEFPPRWIPEEIVWSNYGDAWSSVPFGRFYLNSIFVAASITFLQILTSSLAAFAFARLRFRGRDTLFYLYLVALMIPFAILLLPNFLIIKHLGWFDSYAALIIPPAFSAFSTFLMRQYFRGIPAELDESARMDGASSLRIWWQVIMPNSLPVIGALGVFVFLGAWNSLLWPLVVTNSQEKLTVPVGLTYFQGQFYVRWELLMAAAVIAMIPVLIVYFLAQNWFIKGMSVNSGLKG
jgi:multiple sugar transport system permease protein